MDSFRQYLAELVDPDYDQANINIETGDFLYSQFLANVLHSRGNVFDDSPPSQRGGVPDTIFTQTRHADDSQLCVSASEQDVDSDASDEPEEFKTIPWDGILVLVRLYCPENANKLVGDNIVPDIQ